MAKQKMLKIKYVRSSIGRPAKQKQTIRSLGFRKLNQVVECPDSPYTRGMIRKVNHLVEIIDGEET
jgi:large subunit ribosomal protein L30